MVDSSYRDPRCQYRVTTITLRPWLRPIRLFDQPASLILQYGTSYCLYTSLYSILYLLLTTICTTADYVSEISLVTKPFIQAGPCWAGGTGGHVPLRPPLIKASLDALYELRNFHKIE